nr:radical SAM protein [uncultured Prevotella sp.]
MKESNYNIVFKTNSEQSVLFNSLTKKYILISTKYLNNYLSLIKEPNKYCNITELQPLLNKCKDCGLIIEDKMDELRLIQDFFYAQVNAPSYSLLIMTTYACNFRCWYCIQRHQDVTLNSIVEKRIKKHIEKYLSENKIKNFELSWFGGEPLLNFESIDSISMFAKSFCKQHGISFSCGITTNGSLLSEYIIDRMVDLGFKDYQITLDGDKRNHNKTKYNDKIDNSFDLILENIKMLVEKYPKAEVTLRINYTHKNFTEELPDHIDKVLHSVRNKVAILFRQVWQERDDDTLISKVTPIMLRLKEMGYGGIDDFGNFSMLSCYVEKKHYLSVFPDGSIDNCNNKPLQKARGNLNDKGEIIWKEDPKERVNNIFTIKSDCILCKYLPICMGPCPASREGSITNIKCQFKNPEEYFKNEIKQYVISTSK